ncbi:MAG TPA: peptidoglycan bridge formation glycyltransferase FemA/FemB family protein [Anaerolineales bacterium]|nr:peptidoglycan bridge formation glycyltransferase FemA/FemB family protein [Anaerolineales bacterium]
MPAVSSAEWTQFLQKYPEAHLLQTGEWGELKSSFGWEAVRVISAERDGGAQLLFRRLPLGYHIGYLPKGPVGSPESLELWREVFEICMKRRALFLKIELDLWDGPAWLESVPASLRRWLLPIRMSPHNIQPPRTIIVDLKGTEEQILARMKQKTRYNIRLAEKKGVTVRAWDDLAAFHRMLLLTGQRDGFGVHSLEYYQRAYELLHPKQMAELLVAHYEGKALAALFVARHGIRAYYLYGASTDEERNRMPTYLLQWEAMRWAKAQGCEEYDLWGVPDEDEATLEAGFETRREGLWGVYRFKRGFGGELKRAVQAIDQVFNPFLYRLYLWWIRSRD